MTRLFISLHQSSLSPLIFGWIHHCIRAVIQAGAALIGLWALLKLAVFIDFMGAKKMDEESFLIPLVIGGSTLLIGALPFYGIAGGILKAVGHLKRISYWHLIAMGFIQGFILFPCLAAANFFTGLLLANVKQTQGFWEVAGLMIMILCIGAISAAIGPMVWSLILRAKNGVD